MSPNRFFAQLSANGNVGQEIDFDNSRQGNGPTINLSASLRPSNHLELQLVANRQRLNVNDTEGRSRTLFTANVSRVKGTYSFTSRMFARGIAQYLSTDREATLYIDNVRPRSGTFSGSLLLAYRMNWQSVMFVGYGDDRELSGLPDRARRPDPVDRQVFVKVSYAFQR